MRPTSSRAWPRSVARGADLLAGGGIVGRMLSRHAKLSPPTRVAPIGLLADAAGAPLNVARYALRALARPQGITAIAAVGTSMNAGKTTAAASLVHGLARAGHRVAAIKATGTGACGDFNAYVDAGAHFVADFTDAGMATTYRQPIGRIEAGLASLLGHAAAEGCEAAVVEIADGLFQNETAALLAEPRIRSCFAGIMFAAPDAMGAAGACALPEIARPRARRPDGHPQPLAARRRRGGSRDRTPGRRARRALRPRGGERASPPAPRRDRRRGRDRRMKTVPPIGADGRARRIGGVVLLALAEAMAAGLIAFATRDAFASFGRGGGLPLGALAAIAGGGIAIAAARTAGRVAAELLGQHYAAALRLALFRHVTRMPAKRSPVAAGAALSLRFVGDLSAVRGWVSLGIARLISAGIVLPLVTGSSSCSIRGSAWPPSVPSLLGLAAMAAIGTRLSPIQRRLRARRARLAGDLAERLPHGPELRLLGRMRREERLIGRRTRRLIRAARRRATVAGLLRGVPDIAAGAGCGGRFSASRSRTEFLRG